MEIIRNIYIFDTAHFLEWCKNNELQKNNDRVLRLFKSRCQLEKMLQTIDDNRRQEEQEQNKKELFEAVCNRFAWWEIEEQDKKELLEALKNNNQIYLHSVLAWFECDYEETQEPKDTHIIELFKKILEVMKNDKSQL